MAEDNEPNQDAHLQSEEKQTENNKENQGDPADRLTPDHPRFKEVIAENKELKGSVEKLQEQLEDLNTRITERQNKTGDEDLDSEEQAALDKIARNLERMGRIVTPEGLKRERQSIQYERYSEKHNGSDGYPKFVPVDVQAFAKKKGIDDLEDAYFLLHRQAISQVDARKLSKAPEPPATEKPGKEPEDTTPKGKITPKDIENMTDEEYEQYRGDILKSLKPKNSL